MVKTYLIIVIQSQDCLHHILPSAHLKAKHQLIHPPQSHTTFTDTDIGNKGITALATALGTHNRTLLTLRVGKGLQCPDNGETLCGIPILQRNITLPSTLPSSLTATSPCTAHHHPSITTTTTTSTTTAQR